MKYETILSSIITATSILIAVGFPFIISIATSYKTRKERLLFEMKIYFPKLNAFRELIYYVSTTGIVMNYDWLIQKAKTETEKEEIRKNEAFPFYSAVNYITHKYTKDIECESIHRRIFSFEEANKYLLYSNVIWHDIDCRTDIVKELNIAQLDNLQPYEKDRIKKTITAIDPKYKIDKITIGLIASVAGDIETEVANPLADLTKKYEEPIPSLVWNLFITLSFLLIFGVIIPLLLLQFQDLQKCWTSIVLIFMIIICFILIVIFMGRYIWRIQKE